MKRKFSLNKVMHNERLMISLSLVLAILIWASVIYGPSITETKDIRVPITVKLNTTAQAGENLPDQYYQVIHQNIKEVYVTVEGNRSVTQKLDEKDIIVTADLSSEVKAVKDIPVRLEVTKANTGANYSIVGISTDVVRLSCDYVGRTAYDLSIDATGVKLADSSKYLLGSANADITTISIEGPKTIRDQISKVVAIVDVAEPLTDTKVVMSKLYCLDSDGNRMSDEELATCEFIETGSREIQITIPVYAYRKMDIKPKLVNVPSAYENTKDFVTVTPSTIEFRGTSEGVAEFEKYLNDLKINFDNISGSGTITIPLTVPTGVTITNDVTEIKATVNKSGFTSRRFSVPLDLDFTRRGSTLVSDNITIKNVPANRDISISKTTIDVTVVGNSYSVSRLNKSNISFIIDLKDNYVTGPNLYNARVKITRYNNVWVYYGLNPKTGYDLYVTIE